MDHDYQVYAADPAWVLVPVEPTEAMKQAGSQHIPWEDGWGDSSVNMRDAYAAMLAAAPSPPAGSDGWRDIDAEASAYAAEYVMSTEGPDYEPTEHERHLIEDALHGFIAEHWTAPPPPAGSDEWRDIGSAPKDGTVVLLWGILEDEWEDAVDEDRRPGFMAYPARVSVQKSIWWLYHSMTRIVRPTHWQPLPEAPTPPVAPRG